jgi:peptide/nickel transport system permease protein
MTTAELQRGKGAAHGVFSGAQAVFSGVWPELKRLPWQAVIILGVFVLMAFFAGLISPYDPNESNLLIRLHGPDSQHLLGTDTLGRDVLSRLIYGARTSLTVASVALLVGGSVGLAVGIASGYMGGKVDAFLMRLTDCFIALPGLLIALVFVMTVGPGLGTVVLAISITMWSGFTRIIRSEVLSLRKRDYVALARVAGCSNARIMTVHILPNVLNTFIVLISLRVSAVILTESTLSFLGAGVPPPTATWGNMVSDGINYITSAWWLAIFPGIAITLVVLSLNVLGDWIRDRFDPRLRQL